MLKVSIREHDWLRGLSWAAISLSLILASGYLSWHAQLPKIYNASPTVALKWPETPATEQHWNSSLFQKSSSEQPTAAWGPLAKRFRLAGTFFASNASQQSRKAIIDDLQRHEQQLVAEGDCLDQAIMVGSIFAERVILREGNHAEELQLSFSGPGLLPTAATLNNQKAPASAEAPNPFGKRVGENRWLLQRTELLKYYQELLNNSERLAKVFDSLKPVYQADKIAGYTLIVEGEEAMFNAFGLKENDVIRKVNSMPMISQARAEYFIKEFVNNRANGFVLDIERQGQPQKKIYLIR